MQRARCGWGEQGHTTEMSPQTVRPQQQERGWRMHYTRQSISMSGKTLMSRTWHHPRGSGLPGS